MHVRSSLPAVSLLVLLSAVAHAQTSAEVRAECKSPRLLAPDSTGPVVAAASRNLAIFYVLPAGIAFEDAVYQRLVESAHDVRAWYQCATGGLTWEFAFPEVVRVYHGVQTREYYLDHGDWWGSLLGEMTEHGEPIWSPGTVTALWARGAGWWAGAAQGCLGECGVALVGVEAFPEFNNPEWSGGECPTGTGTALWPCTPLGALAHELGHTVGLPHPLDVAETSADAAHSIMQTHWNYPDFATGSDSPWGFLTLERQTLYRNPFLLSGIDLLQPHDCDLVNLPVTGPTPTASFEVSSEGLTLAATSTSRDAVLNYWTFGDAHVADGVNAAHTYEAPGSYTITLRTTAENAMMARSRTSVEMVACGDLTARLDAWPAAGIQPPRFRLQTWFAALSGGPLDLTAEAVSLQIGSLVLEIPAGSFVGNRGGRWQFSGVISGLSVSSWVQSLGGTRYIFTLEAQGAAVVAPSDSVSLKIGTRVWCTASGG